MSKWYKYDSDRHRGSRNYFFFLLSLSSIVLLPGIISYIVPEKLISARLVFLAFYLTTIVTGVYTVTSTFRQLVFGYIAGLLIMIIAALNAQVLLESLASNTLNFIVSSIFMAFLLYHCLKEVLRSSTIDVQTIYASICGYIILGIIGAIAFDFINGNLPDAFSQAIPRNDFFTFLYFSFITLTTLGYGDITPLHSIPRTVAMFLAVVGQLYLTVLIAMLIGKYFSSTDRS